VRALIAEGAHLAAIVALAASLLVTLHVVMGADERRWGGRTASEWLPSLTSPLPAARDSALAALRLLEPYTSRTIRSAAAMLADHDERVSTSAMHGLLDAARSGGAMLVPVQHEVRRALLDGDSRARANAARVAGALGKLGGSLVPALVIAGADTAELARAAVASALGGTLEVAPLVLERPVRRAGVAHLLSAARDPAWLVREAALEALFRAAPTDIRVAAVVDAALADSSAEVRERATSIRTAMKGRGYATTNPD
jgi:HEAT repeat protein